ncbi:MAG: hypothetical protein J2P48_19135 [Alphaproteobacteria bacterium]|nr:hypothetical protein [Alphaproteobacteria bacterium]
MSAFVQTPINDRDAGIRDGRLQGIRWLASAISTDLSPVSLEDLTGLSLKVQYGDAGRIKALTGL